MRPLLEQVPQLQRLAVFEAVGRLGSFTAAATELGISQPAVSRHVITLEGQLQFPLFDRRANKIELTDQGRRLHDVVRDSFDRMEQRLVDLKRTNERLIIAASATMSQNWLTPRLEELADHLAPSHVSILVYDDESELEDLVFDVAIRGGLGDWAGFRAEKLLPEVVVPVVAPNFAERHQLSSTSDAAELLDLPLLHLASANGFPTTWSGWFAGHGLEYVVPDGAETRSYSHVLNQALSGSGVALAWRYQADDWLRQGLLVEGGQEVHFPQSGYFLTWPVAINRDRRVRQLRDWFRETLPPERFTAHET